MTQPIATNGVVVDADTNQVLLDPDGADLMVMELDRGHASTLQDGDNLSLPGTIHADRTIVVGPDDHIWVRASWERSYMYAISLFAALLTGFMVLNNWRVDTDQVVVEPRETPLVTITRAEQTDG